VKNCPTCQHRYADDVDFCPHDGTHLVSEANHAEGDLAAQFAPQFELVRCLGTGGMGTVYLAAQATVGNRPVALKVLARKLLDDPEFLQRFKDEAGSTGRICHPNVVTIHESGQTTDGTPYIAMEYLEGKTLRQWIESRGPIPALECVEILSQAARGLNAAHKLGIIHRDLKPDNIFLTRDTEGELVVKLVDFGIAKLRESSSHTITGTLMGTPAYMSFEQASGMRSEDLDPRADIYSLGVVAYEMLAGCLPFESDTPVGFISKHLTESPMSFRIIKPDLPALPEIERVVMKALTKNRDLRYSSALDFAREFAEGARAAVPPQSVDPSETEVTALRTVPPQFQARGPAGPAAQGVAPNAAAKTATPAPPDTSKPLSRAAAATATGSVLPREGVVGGTVQPPQQPPEAASSGGPGGDSPTIPQLPAQGPAAPPAPPARSHAAQVPDYAGKLPKAHAVVQYNQRRQWGHLILLLIMLVTLIAGIVWLLAPRIRKLSLSSQWQMQERPAPVAKGALCG